MKKDILIIAHFCSDFDQLGNNRFNYLANLLLENNFGVELITSDFSHFKKQKRDINQANVPYKLTLIKEPVYKKNISFKRFYSHYKLGNNLKDYLKARKKPDLIYCAVPSLDVGKAVADYANQNGVNLVIDVQDLWPEAFKMIFNIPVVSDLIFYPMNRTANYIYNSANKIITVSETYSNIVAKTLKHNVAIQDVFIGTDLKDFDAYITTDNKLYKKGEFWIGYVGTLGHSYDIKSVIQALKKCKDNGITNIKFIVIGDGPLKSVFEAFAKENNVNVDFLGRLDYGKMINILSQCDIAVNPITGGSAASIINKHADYAAAGLPVINTQESIEYRNLVERYNMGINCENGNIDKIFNSILYLYNNEQSREEMGFGSRKLAEEKFDRSHTYQKIIEMLKV